jgi:hypothetical protein
VTPKLLAIVVLSGLATAQTSDTPKKKPYTKAQHEFWSFRPIKDYPAPPVKNSSWAKSPIDSFILAKLDEKNLAPAAPAGKLALLRRATFDLTGLPPTESEINAFVSDFSPDAFAKVVDRLLASPRYGERWGRHWLDVARYADSTGADEDHRYPYAWRYRDFVIDAFNRDLPYDQFVTEQIAGDLIPAKDGTVNVEGIVATGFLAIGPRLIAEQDKVKMLYDFIDEQIDTTSRAFLGLTIACARCHDHKFDPISTEDYYSLAAIFANTKSFAKIGTGGVSDIYYAPLAPAEVVRRWEEHQSKITSKQRQIDYLVEEELERYAAPLRPRIAEYMIATRTGKANGLDPVVVERWTKFLKPDRDPNPLLARWHQATAANFGDVARSYQREFDQQAKDWDARIAEWKKKFAAALEQGKTPPQRPGLKDGELMFLRAVMLDDTNSPLRPPDKQIEAQFPPGVRQRSSRLKDELTALQKASPPEPPRACAVTEGTPVVQKVLLRGNAGSPGAEVTRRFPTILAGEEQAPLPEGSGRLEFGRWLASPQNPLTARVIVNRVWQWHFGEGLVRTPSNWGLLAEKPTHPELLDYLATRFIEDGWSIKSLHRRIMLSAAYQQSSDITAQAAEADPTNRLLSHFSRRRLEVEEMRDAMLALDASIDLTMGGTLQSGTGTDGENSEKRLSIDPSTSKRRTVYLPLRRSNLPTLLNLFDFGDATTTCEGRSRTNVAPQALFMMNSTFLQERAAGLAKQLGTDVSAAYLRVLGRHPTPEEERSALEYIKAVGTRGAESFFRVLLASNEFIYVD